MEDKRVYIENELSDFKDWIVQLVFDNVEINLDPKCPNDRLKNHKVIMKFLQRHFNLARSGYPKSQRNYWIQRGFTNEEADENIKQFSTCYSRSAESIQKKYNCTFEEAQSIFKDRNQRATQTRNSKPEEEKHRINNLKRQRLEDYIRRYGEQEGLRRYNQRIEKYKKAVSFESLVKKYGSKEKAEQVIQKRKAAINTSLKALIERHGEQEGRRRYELQVQRKSKAQTLQGYIERYGLEEGIERFNKRQEKFLKSFYDKPPEEIERINKLKSNSLYGKEQGLKQYNEIKMNHHCITSKRSMNVFKPLHWWLINEMNIDDSDIFYGVESRYEKTLLLDSRLFSYDFCIESLKIIFEYNGLYFHPKSPDDTNWVMVCNPGVTAKEKYEFDQFKNQVAIDAGYKVIELWDDVDITKNLLYAMDAVKTTIKDMNNNEEIN